MCGYGRRRWMRGWTTMHSSCPAWATPATAPTAPNSSFQLDVGGLDDRIPLSDLSLLLGRKRFGRLPLARIDLLAEFGELAAHGRVRQGVDDGGVELFDDRLRRAFRQPNSVPQRNVVARQAALFHRGNLGSE